MDFSLKIGQPQCLLKCSTDEILVLADVQVKMGENLFNLVSQHLPQQPSQGQWFEITQRLGYDDANRADIYLITLQVGH